jgi:hypothetical protein
MKTSLYPRLLLTLGLLASAAWAAPFATDRTLEIELSDRDDISLDELHFFTQAAERVLAERAYPGPFKVQRWSGASQSETGPLLDLRLIRWAPWTPADFECRFYATAIADGERYDLGVFVGRADAFAPTRLQQEERLVKSAAGGLEKLFDALVEKGLIASE